MFKCDLTGKTTEPLEKMRKVVSVTRERVYVDPRTGEEIGRGTEIVKELQLSEEGYARWAKDHPELEQPRVMVTQAPVRGRGIEHWSGRANPDEESRRTIPMERGGNVVYVTPEEAMKGIKK